MNAMREFAASADRCVVIEEGAPFLASHLRAAGVEVEDKAEEFRFGELNVARVRSILKAEPEQKLETPRGRPPQLCPGCPHRSTFEVLKELDCIVAGDIGCYTLGALSPLAALGSQLCMGASIGMGLGLRHVLPDDEARRVVSVIGDSTFIHSGITGLVEMVYNTPPTGHVVVVMDNGTTAMTGLQEHPATGRLLDGSPAGRVSIEGIARALGVGRVSVVDPFKEAERLREEVRDALTGDGTTVIVARRPCILALRRDRRRAEKEGGADAG